MAEHPSDRAYAQAVRELERGEIPHPPPCAHASVSWITKRAREIEAATPERAPPPALWIIFSAHGSIMYWSRDQQHIDEEAARVGRPAHGYCIAHDTAREEDG